MFRQTGVRPKELETLVEMPDSCWHVWKMFIELSSARGGSGFGANPISYSEILAYCQLTSFSIEQWELDLIRKFDAIYLKYQADRIKSETPKAKR